jgi:hypothetical protein
MKLENIEAVEAEAIKLLERIADYKVAMEAKYCYMMPKESGALRRQSMELTRALAKMRKP